MKKLVSVILAVMLLGTSFVFAEETVKNAAEDATLTANDCSDWAADDIAQAKEIGLLDDVSGLIYRENITREKFCELIFDFIMITQGGITTSEYQNQFTDTDNRKVVVLRAAEIIYGKSDTEFAPNDSLTREEAATIIVRMINRVMPMPVTEMYFAYDDSDDIAEWASSAVQVMSNLGFFVMGEREGLTIKRTKVGDRYVLEEMLKCGHKIGGEQSGHIIFKNYATTGDGQLSGAMLASIMSATGKSASETASVMTVLPQTLVNIKASPELKAKLTDDKDITAAIEDVKRTLGKRGRILVRASGTEPLIRVMLEGEDIVEIKRLAKQVAKVIEGKA